MSGRDKNLQPQPPPTSSKELLSIWNAWTRIGDREIVREAIVKGLHIEWAHTFLSARKNLDDAKTQKWFRDEVYVWISELLARQQIFKASHILTNLQLDPVQEFTTIFNETFDSELRDFLGNYLSKMEKLDGKLVEAWKFLRLLNKNDDVLKGTDYEFVDFNVKVVDGKDVEWKSDVGTLLFLKSNDPTLKPFLTPHKIWRYLIDHHRVDLIKSWIETYFTDDPEPKSLLFTGLEIADELLNILFDQIETFPSETQTDILNQLSKFGIFKTDERTNLTAILKRFVDTQRLDLLYEVLRGKTSTVTVERFDSLLLEHCVRNVLFPVLNSCDVNYEAHSDFIQKRSCKFLDFVSSLKTGDKTLGESIFETARFLWDDPQTYFNRNPIIFLAVLLFRDENTDLFKMCKSQAEICLKDATFKTGEIWANLPFLSRVMYDTDVRVSYQELLKRHCGLKADIFNFGARMPNFNSEELVVKYAYSKRMNFGFYIKQARPSFAAKLYVAQRLNDVSNEKTVFRKVFKIVAQNFLNKEITASCVAFLEMIGIASDNLRIYIKAANIFYESIYTFDEIQDLLQNVSESPVCFLEKLEKTLVGNFLGHDHTHFDLADEMRKQEVAVQFALMHKLKLPELYLESCARNDYWFPFVVFIQRHNYPLLQVQKLIYNFADPNLVEHLFHGLTQDIQIDEQKDLLMRDTRKYYLSRIGFRKNLETLSTDGMQSSVSSFGSYGSTGSSSGNSDFFEHDSAEEFRSDMLQILIKCHNCIDPPKALLQACYFYKNPIFAVLATSYEPDSIISNWFTWLSVSCGIENEFSNVDGGILNAPLVAQILNVAIEKCHNKSLLESFLVFLPENPLRLFVAFLNDCVDLNFDDESLAGKLAQFKKEMTTRKSSVITTDIDYQMLFLNNKSWLEVTAIRLTCNSLHFNYKSRYDQLRFLNFLEQIGFGSYFVGETPDFAKYGKILACLLLNNCDIVRLNLSVICADSASHELSRCVDELVALKYYNCAFEIGKLAGLQTDFIIISEWRYRFENQIETGYWELCDATFRDVKLQSDVAVRFFLDCANSIQDQAEKYQVLNLAHKWVTGYNYSKLHEIESKLWLAYFEVENQIADADFAKMAPQKLLYSEMKQKLETLQTSFDLVEDDAKRLDRAICRLLQLDDFWQALRLAKIFRYESADLDVIVLGCSLAEGLLMPYQLNAKQRMLLNKQGHLRTLSNRRRRTLRPSKAFSSFCSGASSPSTSTVIHLMDHVDAPFHDTLAALQTLSECAKVGGEIVQNVLLNYRIALNIEKSYQDVFMCKDPMSMLREALKNDCMNKLEVVNDFIMLFKWSNDQIANFLCEELIVAISDQIKTKLNPLLLWNINLEADFHLVLQLLNENCSLLGLKLYKCASSLHKVHCQSNADLRIQDIELAIDLLIRAHDCFTADCNMEGISTVLRKSQNIISLLTAVKNWKLIVRLLTGVARYTEMNYVFHILRENEQFEFLLCRGSRRDNSLKVALLKYLKKYCPENRELYRMVALHFTLFSEIAQLWEEEAKSIVRNLIAISKLEMQNNGLTVELQPYVLLSNTDGTKICLNKAMTNYTHATEYHLQGEKLAKATNSAKQAQLLALQISMLKGLASNSTTICILRLTEAQMASLIATQLRFPQSLILIEAYNHEADWACVLFEQFVICNESNYLDSFLTALPLTDSIVNDISRKFMGLKSVSDCNAKNMKEIVRKCNSVSTKYRVASELGFGDVVEDLLAGNQLAFLKDTVWKKGYKS